MHAIQTHNLSLSLGESQALANISCCIKENEFVAILGPNGAGKSTFLKVLLGVLEPSSGNVRVFEKKPRDANPEWIGYVPQAKTLDRNFPALTTELVLTGLRRTWVRRISAADRNAAREALEMVGASHLADRPLARLSGGELQRIYLARSLARKPRLILLDEPATGIDTVGEADFYRLLDQYRNEQNATILMVTHNQEVASAHADRVMVLNRRLFGFGTPEETMCPECLQSAYNPAKHSADIPDLRDGNHA
ncbi:MAG: metal ABC transporter ATP-binding protein [Desulfobulbaceae bacterium]|nr:metal ABC transporter ATP-binding protein [Desulfobulbaceae bacterium]